MDTEYTLVHHAWCHIKPNFTSGVTYTIEIVDSKLTVSAGSSGYTVNSSVSANGDIDPEGSHSVSSTQTYSVSLNDGYKVSSVTNTTGGTLSPTAAELEGRYGSFTVTLTSPTSDGNLTITTTDRTQYSLIAPTITPSPECTISPSIAKDVYEGDAITYTVTPAAGYIYKTCSFSGTKSGEIVRSDNSFTFYPTSAGTFSVTYGTPGVNVPVARIGNKIEMSSADVNVSAYVTSDKCYDVNEIVVYYSNNSGFRNDEGMVAKSKSFSPVSPATKFDLKSTHTLTLLASEVETIVGNGETLYVRIKAHNENGYSEYSDVVSIVYENNTFEANPVLITPSDACDGNHEFTWSDMFLPTPTDYAVIDAFGNNVKGEFSLTEDGQMVWNVIESIGDDGTVNIKPNGTYTFTFTAKRNGYTSANAVLTINFATSGTEDAIAGIYLNDDSGSPVTSDGSLTPWETATLGATESSSDIVKIGWTVSPVSDSYILTPTEGTSVKFKGKAAGIYTVTARGLTSTCGSSKSKTIELTVNNDSEPCN